MKRTALLSLALCVMLLPACSGSAPAVGPGTVCVAYATTAPPAPTPTAAPSGLRLTVTDTGGAPVPGAVAALMDMKSLKAVSAVTDRKGAAGFGEHAPGSRYLLVSAKGYLEYAMDIEITGTPQLVSVQLKPAAALKRFLMTVTAVSAADKKSRVYLAQSADGAAWEPFPGFTPFEETGGAGVAVKDGMVYVYTETAIRRYRIATGQWDLPRAYTAHTDGYFNGKGAVSFTALTREPSLFTGNGGELMLVAAHTRTRPFDYADSALNNSGKNEISLVGLAREQAGSLGLIYRYDAARYLYKDKYGFSQFKARDISSPFVIATPGAHYLLMSRGAGVAALKSDKEATDYQQIPSLKSGLLYTGANSGATGYWDAETKKFVLVVSVNAGGKAALKRYALDSLTAAISGGAGDISLSFLNEAVSSVACPVLWDTAGHTAPAAGGEPVGIGYGTGWDSGIELSFSKKPYCVFACRQAFYSVFTLSADIQSGTDAAARGLAYCWNPVGDAVGGYVFAVDGKRWALSLLRPAQSKGLAVSPIKSMTVLASGDCPESALPCTLTVRCGMGTHVLYINGKKVGEYRDTLENRGFGAGYAGLFAEGSIQTAGLKLTQVKIIS